MNALSLLDIEDGLDEWDRAEIAYAEVERSKKELAKALALFACADRFRVVRHERLKRTEKALAEALDNAIEARDEIDAASDLVLIAAGLVCRAKESVR